MPSKESGKLRAPNLGLHYCQQCEILWIFGATMMKNSKGLIILLIMWLLTACGDGLWSTKDKFITIHGVVRDGVTSEPVAGVEVMVRNRVKTPVVTTRTNSSGEYSVKVKDGERYEFLFSAYGYRSQILENFQIAGRGSIDSLENLSLEIAKSGFVTGLVRDAVNLIQIPGVAVRINDAEGIERGTTVTNGTGKYTVELPANTPVELSFMIDGFYPTVYKNVAARENGEVKLEDVLIVDSSATGNGDIQGQIVDAITTSPVAGATVKFRPGQNVKAGSVTAQVVAGSDGFYFSANTLSSGTYTAEAGFNGYSSAFGTVVVIGGQSREQQTLAIAPAPISGKLQIVLSWGESSSEDLDSHLTGPVFHNFTERFHVYYDNLEQLSVLGNSVATLDHDSSTSSGTETIEILEQYEGIYRYSVHNHSKYDQTGSMDLSVSEAKVEIYREGIPIEVFNVPAGPGNLWTVFEISGETITAVNAMTDVFDPVNIAGLGGGQ